MMYFAISNARYVFVISGDRGLGVAVTSHGNRQAKRMPETRALQKAHNRHHHRARAGGMEPVHGAKRIQGETQIIVQAFFQFVKKGATP